MCSIGCRLVEPIEHVFGLGNRTDSESERARRIRILRALLTLEQARVTAREIEPRAPRARRACRARRVERKRARPQRGAARSSLPS
jgi:hypothetical protein